MSFVRRIAILLFFGVALASAMALFTRQASAPNSMACAACAIMDSLSGSAKDGRIKLLAVNSLGRSSSAPALPAMAETIPGFDASVWLGIAAALLAAGPIMRVLGPRLEAMITRVLGVLLAALAAQFVIDGIVGAFGLR
mgnify:CR=1 FL=1